jgi:hypothetical protein
MSEMLKKFVSGLNIVIPFLEPYPTWVKAFIGVWVLLTALIVVCLLFCRSPQKAATQPISPEQIRTKTLHDLFLADFDKTKMLGEYHLTNKDKVVYTVEYIILCDFDSKTKYLSIYLPKSDYTFTACQFLLTKYDDILDGNIRSLMEGMAVQFPGESPETFDELKFSGRIYLYHETYLLPDRIDSLKKEYENKKLFPQFRGRDYLIMRNSPLYKK